MDPAYEYEMGELATICQSFTDIWKVHQEQGGQEHEALLVCGMLLGQLAAVYKLSPPGGLIDVPALFRRDNAQVE